MQETSKWSKKIAKKAGDVKDMGEQAKKLEKDAEFFEE